MRNSLYLLICVLPLCGLCGCWQQHIDRSLSSPWDKTQLNTSSSAAVLSYFHDPNAEARGELLSQSDTVAASWGQKSSGKEQWLNVAAFDEQNAIAIRKYFFFVDENARTWLFIHPKWSAQFNAQLVADPGVLDKTYPDENARRVAILQYVLKAFQDDINKIQQDNKMISVCMDTVNSAFSDILNTLREHPAFAAQLTMPRGMEFQDPAFYHGRVELHQHDNIVTVVVKEGAISDSKFLSYEPSIWPSEPVSTDANTAK